MSFLIEIGLEIFSPESIVRLTRSEDGRSVTILLNRGEPIQLQGRECAAFLAYMAGMIHRLDPETGTIRFSVPELDEPRTQANDRTS